ncbi:MAG: glycosyltransferase [Bacillota bacterium]|nr:glycosyltransferase [Bacillota bacterium]
MRILIMSDNTGEGHNSCAKAIQEYFELQGDNCTIVDSLRFISRPVSTAVSEGFTCMYRHFPSLFRNSYTYMEKHPGMFHDRSAVYRILTLGTDRLRQYLEESRYDGIICTHMFPALMLTHIKKLYGLDLPTCFVATDYTCSPLVKDSSLDRCFIPHPSLAWDFECDNIPLEHIVGSGIPVRQMFYRSKPKEEAKIQCAVPPHHKHLVMMGGSMGCGPILELARRFTALPEDCHLTVVCGTNRGLQRQLLRKFAHQKNFHIRGFVRDMSTLMDSADLYLTKPGGIGVTEAALKNLPMVLIDAVAGCEEYNRLYFTRNGGAKTASTPEDLARLCQNLLENDAKRIQMVKRLQELPKNNAAQMIHSFFLQQSGEAPNLVPFPAMVGNG